MRLRSFFDHIGPYLEGGAGIAETRLLLYGASDDKLRARTGDEPRGPVPDLTAEGADARRLAIYGRFCRIHRVETIEGVYPDTRDAVLHAAGPAGHERWHRLIDEYFAAHPMHHVELSENGAAFPLFLEGRPDLPPLVAELADFEWWEWRTRSAPDAPSDADPDEGPPRLSGAVELRPYRWDFVGWLDVPPDEGPLEKQSRRAEPPTARACVVLFWRDRDLDPRRDHATPLELLVLKTILDGQSLAAPAAVGETEWRETLTDLRDAGVVLGGRDAVD